MKTGWCEIHETTTIDGECSLCELDDESYHEGDYDQGPEMEDMSDE